MKHHVKVGEMTVIKYIHMIYIYKWYIKKKSSFHENKWHHVTVCLFLQVHFYFGIFMFLFIRCNCILSVLFHPSILI